MSRKELLEKMIVANYSMFYFCNKDDSFNVEYFKNTVLENLQKISDTNENLIDIHNLILTSYEIDYLFKINFKNFHNTLKALSDNIVH